MIRNIIFGLLLIFFISACVYKQETDVCEVNEKTSEQIMQKAKDETQAISDKCYKMAFVKKEYSTLYAINAAIKQNDCLEKVLIEEIREILSVRKQKEMREVLQQTRQSGDKFYELLYNENRYCEGQCGLTAQIVQQSKVTELFEKILYDMILIKLNKGD